MNGDFTTKVLGKQIQIWLDGNTLERQMADEGERDDGNLPYVAHHSFDDETPASLAIVRAVCALENVDPLAAPEEMGFTLYDHVDPQALNRIIAGNSDTGDVCVEFTVEDYRIRVVDTGRLRVELRA